MPFWVCRIPAARLIDLRHSDEREKHGVSDTDLVDDDWSACQALGAALRPLAAGVIAPCAALPAKANVTLFGARRAIAWDRPQALASAVSATRVAIGRPPPGLVGQVRRPLGPPALGRLFRARCAQDASRDLADAACPTANDPRLLGRWPSSIVAPRVLVLLAWAYVVDREDCPGATATTRSRSPVARMTIRRARLRVSRDRRTPGVLELHPGQGVRAVREGDRQGDGDAARIVGRRALRYGGSGCARDCGHQGQRAGDGDPREAGRVQGHWERFRPRGVVGCWQRRNGRTGPGGRRSSLPPRRGATSLP